MHTWYSRDKYELVHWNAIKRQDIKPPYYELVIAINSTLVQASTNTVASTLEEYAYAS